MDPEEPEQIDEDEILDVVVPAPAPAGDIAQAEADMAAQPDDVDIGADGIAEVMIQA